MEVLNPLARDYKSIGTMKKDLAELQDELAQAHRQVCKISTRRNSLIKMSESFYLICNYVKSLTREQQQVHISEARVATALDKLAYMEELVNDRLLQDRSTTTKESEQTSPSPSCSTDSLDVKRRIPRKSLNVSGPVQPYHPRLKNFWYPVAFSTDLKDDTMVCSFFF